MRGAPVSDDIAAAIAAFFHAGRGPSHTAVTRAMTGAGLNDGYQYSPDGNGPTKEDRVLSAFRRAERNGGGRKLVEGLLSALRHQSLIGTDSSSHSEDGKRLRLALGRTGWLLSDDGQLRAFAGADVDTGGREALDESLARLRGSTSDPALLIGTAKDLLESVAKFVLEETGMPVPSSMGFDALWHIARERLGVLPERVDKSLPGFDAIRAIHQSSWSIAKNVNDLRNLQGTGHGRTLPTGVTEDLALLVVREACSVAEYMLRRLDATQGRN
ncbi:abortive infection family protein [Cellulomonas sp. ES6]|uniref:abortive infection family protein n=1 Tax=Cellulomonas sp. ES6 TaxID=3039384 RepID=UPI0024B6E024|nr:abortive infection family protein [Cellulomonas sp. ES6]WHP16614.1 abortive infection family protein [Cellulomonas sp. ES6]